MKRRKKIFGVLALLLIGMVLASSKAEAWPRIFRRGRSSSSTTYSSRGYPQNVGGSPQARAVYKANLMARTGRYGHGVAPLVASFEGIGRGSSPNCGTCTPRRGMTLVADASAWCPSRGCWYRVRGWN